MAKVRCRKMSQNVTKKQKAVELLGFGFSVVETSEKVGVNRKTIQRWLELEDFKNQVLEQQKETLERVSKRLSSLALQGLETLSELMQSENETIRLRASSSVLSRFTEILELLRLEKRLEVLEGEVLQKKRSRAL